MNRAAIQAAAIYAKKKTMNLDKNPETIQAMFGKIAKPYDLTNSILSFQLHKWWNRRLISSLKDSQILLDICAGTGEIAYLWLKQQKTAKTAIMLDFCQEMLQEAKHKQTPYVNQGHTVRFIQADATELPIPNHSVDAVSVAYGVRNIQQPEKCFAEVHRVLNPQGSFSILELTQPKNRLLAALHTYYLKAILPFLGGLLTKEKEAYAYLAKSVHTFTKPETLKSQLEQAGFSKVTLRPLSGGIATLITAIK